MRHLAYFVFGISIYRNNNCISLLKNCKALFQQKKLTCLHCRRLINTTHMLEPAHSGSSLRDGLYANATRIGPRSHMCVIFSNRRLWCKQGNQVFHQGN